MKIDGIAIVASATIEHGVKTDRVRSVRKAKTPTGPKRYRADTSRGRTAPAKSPTLQVCISMTKDERAQLDAMCERLGMSRSHFLRQAFKHFGEHVFSGNQERLWRKAL